MQFARVVETSRRVSETSKRTEKTALLTVLLRETPVDEIEMVVAYLSGNTRQGRVGVGWATVRDATAPPAETVSLDIAEVDRTIGEISRVQGAGADRRRRELLHLLFARATTEEQRFLTGLLMGEVRQGALEGVMVEALAKASGASVERVRRAVMMAGEMAAVARDLLRSGDAALDRYSVQLFRPVQPMLAQTAEDVEAALDQLGEAALEYKFDGARVQVHRSGDQVAVYSRRMNDVTAAVPEIVQAVRRMPVKEVILDGEALTFDTAGRPNPFQVTMRRFGRRLDIERMQNELPMTPVWFDALYVDGAPIVDETQATRFETLRHVVPAHELVPHLVTADRDAAARFVYGALEKGHEGAMAKARNAPYAAGGRGQSWLKVKQVRTLDLVVLAAEWGHGRRHGWLSNLHLGARDTEKGGFAMLGKTFKGLTDEMLAWQTEQLLQIEIARDKYTVYVEPKLVVEIAFNDVQVSPRYPSGLALRFARVKRYRPDKSPAEADTFAMVQEIAIKMGVVSKAD